MTSSGSNPLPETGAAASYGLDPQTFALAHPFHAVLDPGLRLLQCGRGLKALVPELAPGMALASAVELLSPPVPLQGEAVSALHGQAVVMARRDGTGLRIGGAFLGHAQGHVFLGYPQATSIEDMLAAGIVGSMLPPTDALGYSIGTLAIKNVALDELDRLTRGLEARVAERTRELDAARRAAVSASEAKSAFLAAISHEIRTPLHGVLGTLELLADSPLDPRQRHHVQVIERSGRMLLGLLDDVLDLTKLEAGRMEVEHAAVDLIAVGDHVRDLMSAAAMRKGLALELDVEPGFDPLRVGDAARLAQVLLNLTGNAIKFTERGEVRMQFGAVRGRGPGWVRLAVADTGVGVAEAARPRLFQAFSQADAGIARQFGGTGLGLAIVARLAEAMGGRALHEDIDGCGSRFAIEVELPLASTALVSLPAVAESAGAAPPSVRGLRLLLAEDHDVNQMIARAMLEEAGHQVEVVADGEAAVSAVRRGGFDLVLMDVQMPNLDGLAATRRIRADTGDHADVPIVGVTASAFADDRRACLDAGMQECLSKPFSRHQLVELVARQARRRPAA